MWKWIVLGVSVLASCQREPLPASVPPADGVFPADRVPPPEGVAPAASVSAPGAAARAPGTPRSMAAEGRLPEGVRPVGYQLLLEIDPRRPDFHGQARIALQLEQRVASISLHARELALTRVSLRVPGSERSISAQPQLAPGPLGESGLTRLQLSEPLGPGPSQLEIEFSGKFNARLRGLYKVENGGDSYAFTQFEAIDARRAFPCFDEPRFKTPFEVTLRVPAGNAAIANTAVREQKQLPTQQIELSFVRTERLPTYLLAFAVGPLDVIEAPPLAVSGVRPRTLPLRGVAARDRGAELAFALNETPRLLESLERYLGVAYPYDKLDLIAVPDFASGAMENAGAITFRDTLLLLGVDAPEEQRRASVSVNAHELAHQWFGDLVTMPWWDDLWLNEGFATWLASRVLQDVHPEYRAEFARIAGLERAFDMDGRQSARQVRQPIESDHDIRNAFDAITYTKGGALLAMFERYVGPERFRAGLRAYLERHRFGSGTSRELLAALDSSSGKPVAAAFSSFLDQPGVPSVSAELSCVPGSAPRVRLRQRRFAPLGSGIDPAGRWQVPVCLRYAGAAAAGGPAPSKNEPSAEQCVLLDTPEGELTLAEEQRCPSWVFPNARASGYYRWSLATADLAALLEHGYASLDAGERLSLLANTVAAVRSGAQSLGELMAVVRRLGGERERELVVAALEVLEQLRRELLGAEELPGYRRLVRELVLDRQRQLGLFPTRAEQGDAKLLRTELVHALAFEARDAALRRELDRLGRAHLGLVRDARVAQLPSELLELALAVAVQEGGKPVIERVRAALAASNDGLERVRLLSALGSNLNPELSPLVLEVSLADELRTNERLSVLFGQMREIETREVSYRWVEQHFDALVLRLGGELGAQLTRLPGAFCNTESVERVGRFFTPRAPALTGGPRSLRLSLEAIRACAAFAEAERRNAHEYFTSRTNPSPSRS
ncbi:MAG: M1 family metallopeptidase [Deltaproteobacteria bacterium]